jgi:thymidylate kinase
LILSLDNTCVRAPLVFTVIFVLSIISSQLHRFQDTKPCFLRLVFTGIFRRLKKSATLPEARFHGNACNGWPRHCNQEKLVTRVIIDGNDGTGKTTIVAMLKTLGYDAQDRGLPTKLTDTPGLPVPEGEIYIILDAPVAVSRMRLATAGKDLDKEHHKIESLVIYRWRFRDVAAQLPRCHLIDASGTAESVLARCLAIIEQELA